MFRQISSRIRLPRNSRDLLHAANLRHGTDGFTSPPKEGVLRIFFALKNPTASAGFEPANLVTKGQHTREYCGSERGHWKKSTPFCASPLCVTRAVWSQRLMDFTQRSTLLPLQNSSYSYTTWTERLRWTPNSLRNSRWAITKLYRFCRTLLQLKARCAPVHDSTANKML